MYLFGSPFLSRGYFDEVAPVHVSVLLASSANANNQIFTSTVYNDDEIDNDDNDIRIVHL